MLKPVTNLRVRLATPSTAIPDPAKIMSTGEWYYLDHISSGLAAFNSGTKRFGPLLAESWESEADGTHVFRLRPDIRFHDGTPITARDVVWSIKRQLLLKTSTHFPLWDYIRGCENLKQLDEDCEGLRIRGEREIVISLKVRTDSFFLQLASPETGIWSAEDMNPVSADLKATKFSGPYAVAKVTEQEAVLTRNPNSPLSGEYPNSPRQIRILSTPVNQLDQALIDGKVDLVVRSYRPLGEKLWEKIGIKVTSTTPSMIFYLFGTGHGPHPEIGRDFVESLWKINQDSAIIPADTFLPFSGSYSLNRSEFIAALPEHTKKKLRVLLPKDFFPSAFLDQLQSAANGVGTKLDFSELPGKQWLNAFDDPETSKKYDFILSSYAASERYPAVQLRYITHSLAKSPIDLKAAESPELTISQIKILKDYQRWLIRSSQAVPLFFGSTIFLHQRNLDLGDQPSTDAEIELWRVQERVQ